MAGINEKLYPEFIDISNYPHLNRVFVKQLERNEQILVEIRDALVKHNKLHTVPAALKQKRAKPKVTQCK